MTGDDLLAALVRAGVRRASGVPCSYFGSFYASAPRSDLRYQQAAHEGLAVSLAAGWAMAGQLPCVLMQNSGLGNAINPLTSLTGPYRLPVLLLISGRAWKVKDEPQHQLMGEHLEAFLDAAGVPHAPCPTTPAELVAAVQRAADQARASRGPVALLVRQGTFAKVALPTPEAPFPTRRELLERLLPKLDQEVVVSTTGFTSRDLYAVGDRARNFYMQGSMGHAASIGLALAESGQRVVVLDGDGAALMHLGAMAMVGQHPGLRLCHLVFDNGVHESTGGQPISTRRVEFAQVARALGYARASEVGTIDAFDRAIDEALTREGPSCVVARVRVEAEGKPAPRITEKLNHDDVAERLRENLCRKGPDVSGG